MTKQVMIADYINKSNVGDKVNLCLNYLSQIELVLDYELLEDNDKFKLVKILVKQHQYILSGRRYNVEFFKESIGDTTLTGRDIKYTLDVLFRLQKFVYKCMNDNEIHMPDVTHILKYMYNKYGSESKAVISENIEF